jgi:hypothetical protein
MSKLEEKRKKAKLKRIASELLKDSQKAMKDKIDKAINSGSLDIDSWDERTFILPKIIAAALLEDEAEQYKGKGTSFEKSVKKEIKNLRYFL